MIRRDYFQTFYHDKRGLFSVQGQALSAGYQFTASGFRKVVQRDGEIDPKDLEYTWQETGVNKLQKKNTDQSGLAWG